MIPVKSDGKRSGVNWTLLNSNPKDFAKALTRVVLPTPGMSSNNICPEDIKEVIISSISLSFPTIIFEIFFINFF